MIRVKKPAMPPAILKKRGIDARQAHCAAYSVSPLDYKNGSKAFDHDGKIYNANSVKNALIKAQHSKCCYCECKTTPGSFGDVEHFRPKAGYQQEAGEPLGKPGYYWLAYEWSNLYLSCQVCNQQFKRNLFPLEDKARRARCHSDNVDAERALFVDPGGSDDPSLFIGFREEVPFAIGGNARGRATIKSIGLDRPVLMESRLTLLSTIKLLRDTRDYLEGESAAGRTSPELDQLLLKHTTKLAECVQDSAEFAAMARALLQ
jgi:uncharacterized protein (TIGR02646 family)